MTRYGDIRSRRVDITRLECNHPDGWLGQVRNDPSDCDSSWYQDDDPDPWALIAEPREKTT